MSQDTPSPSSSRTGNEGASKSSNEPPDDHPSDSTTFECNICLDTARDAVVSSCGHLFCWPCLHEWFRTKPHRTTCPVCKNPINKEQVTPIYGRGGSTQDPREKTVPPRPQGQRNEADYSSSQNTFPNFGFGDGFHMSFGIGAFPFGFFASTLNIGEFRAAPAAMNQAEIAHDQFISKIFLYLAIGFIVWLLYA